MGRQLPQHRRLSGLRAALAELTQPSSLRHLIPAATLAMAENAHVQVLSIKGISPLLMQDAPIPWFSEVTSA